MKLKFVYILLSTENLGVYFYPKSWEWSVRLARHYGWLTLGPLDIVWDFT